MNIKIIVIGFFLAISISISYAHDVDGDGVIGLAESIHALQVITGTVFESGITGISVFSNLSNSLVTVLSVPADKRFLLTDIIGQAQVDIFQNDIQKLSTRVGGIWNSSNGVTAYPNPINISSGIVFDPGTEVRVRGLNMGSGYATDYRGYVTLTGYLY